MQHVPGICERQRLFPAGVSAAHTRMLCTELTSLTSYNISPNARNCQSLSPRNSRTPRHSKLGHTKYTHLERPRWPPLPSDEFLFGLAPLPGTPAPAIARDPKDSRIPAVPVPRTYVETRRHRSRPFKWARRNAAERSASARSMPQAEG